MDIRGAHIVPLLMAHLALDGRLRLQPGLDQRAARHGAEAVAADVYLGVVAHRPQSRVNRALGYCFPWLGVSSRHQVEFAGDLVDMSSKVIGCGDKGTR